MDESFEGFSHTLRRFIRDADGKQRHNSNRLRELKELLNRGFSLRSPDPDSTGPQPLFLIYGRAHLSGTTTPLLGQVL